MAAAAVLGTDVPIPASLEDTSPLLPGISEVGEVVALASLVAETIMAEVLAIVVAGLGRVAGLLGDQVLRLVAAVATTVEARRPTTGPPTAVALRVRKRSSALTDSSRQLLIDVDLLEHPDRVRPSRGVRHIFSLGCFQFPMAAKSLAFALWNSRAMSKSFPISPARVQRRKQTSLVLE